MCACAAPLPQPLTAAVIEGAGDGWRAIGSHYVPARLATWTPRA